VRETKGAGMIGRVSIRLCDKDGGDTFVGAYRSSFGNDSRASRERLNNSSGGTLWSHEGNDPKGVSWMLEDPRKSSVCDSGVPHQEWIVGEVKFRS
jgi:hypothetical protein